MEHRHCINSSSETYGWNQWIDTKMIVYKDSLVNHKINEKKVFECKKTQIGGEVI
jgi:hypothetical protein